MTLRQEAPPELGERPKRHMASSVWECPSQQQQKEHKLCMTDTPNSDLRNCCSQSGQVQSAKWSEAVTLEGSQRGSGQLCFKHICICGVVLESPSFQVT